MSELSIENKQNETVVGAQFKEKSQELKQSSINSTGALNSFL